MPENRTIISHRNCRSFEAQRTESFRSTSFDGALKALKKRNLRHIRDAKFYDNEGNEQALVKHV